MRRRRRGRIRRTAAKGAIFLLAVAGAFGAWKAWTWPDVAALSRSNPTTTAFIERWRSERRAEGADDAPDRRFVPYAKIADGLKRAVVVAEDARFFSHRGFDVTELRNAVGDAIADGEPPRGASTITQQLAKNLWLSPSRNPIRKLEEAILTRQLERNLSKRRILELYLNVVEWGPGVFGADAAARRYFGKPAAFLDDEAAALAASLPAPRRWYPGSVSRAYARHVRRVRSRMEEARPPV